MESPPQIEPIVRDDSGLLSQPWAAYLDKLVMTIERQQRRIDALEGRLQTAGIP